MNLTLGQPVVHTVRRGDLTGQQGGTGGRADGGNTVKVFISDAGGRQTVQIRRMNVIVSGAMHGPGALVVGQYEKNVFSLA
jgi:hypothetical protein